MLTYCILQNKINKDLIVTETGFSIFAFFLGPIWGLFKKLWLYSSIGVIFLIMSNSILETYNISNLFIFFSFISSFFWGKFARELYIQNLISKNFRPIKHVNANSRETAFIQYLTEEKNE